ncbi:hypothetical protein PoB_005187300 [Plakobranchus ocellatus]|uniref:Uncharacterized protein n=1 Tax=Plakobranchus ocellatus TaxID=259542 RepID=A0AAV4C1R7_9GAST|nr:hypothetical protein PoB_005187300 [Plakobranchus ocellatus]
MGIGKHSNCFTLGHIHPGLPRAQQLNSEKASQKFQPPPIIKRFSYKGLNTTRLRLEQKVNNRKSKNGLAPATLTTAHITLTLALASDNP